LRAPNVGTVNCICQWAQSVVEADRGQGRNFDFEGEVAQEQ